MFDHRVVWYRKELYRVASEIHFRPCAHERGTKTSCCSPLNLTLDSSLEYHNSGASHGSRGDGFIARRITPGDWFIGGDTLGGTKPYGPVWVRNLFFGECLLGRFGGKTIVFLC